PPRISTLSLHDALPISTSTPPRRMIVLICAARGAPLIRKDDLHRKGEMMTDHEVVGREEWAAAREKLLVREKEHARQGDELARQDRKSTRLNSSHEWIS